MEQTVMYGLIAFLVIVGAGIRAIYWMDDNRKKPKKDRAKFNWYLLGRSIVFGAIGVGFAIGVNNEYDLINVNSPLGLILVIPISYFGESIWQKTLKKIEDKIGA